MRSCLNAGVDAPTHLLELDDAGVQVLLQKKLPFVCTLDDLIYQENEDSQQPAARPRASRSRSSAFKRAFRAGVTIVFGSGATSDIIPHGIAGRSVQVLRASGA